MAMAVVSTGVWLRSNSVADAICFAVGTQQHTVNSSDGSMSWYTSRVGINGGYFTIATANKRDPMFVVKMLETVCPISDRQWTADYSWSAVPLTLLSAYLFLGKMRNRA